MGRKKRWKRNASRQRGEWGGTPSRREASRLLPGKIVAGKEGELAKNVRPTGLSKFLRRGGLQGKKNLLAEKKRQSASQSPEIYRRRLSEISRGTRTPSPSVRIVQSSQLSKGKELRSSEVTILAQTRPRAQAEYSGLKAGIKKK